MKKHINKQATREWNITHNKKTGKTYYYHRGQKVSEDFYLKTRLYKRKTMGKRYTTGQIIAMASQNKISINLANLGLTPEWAAEQTDSTVDEILDVKNWNPDGRGFPTDKYTNPRTGVSYKAVFSYEGESYFLEITP